MAQLAAAAPDKAPTKSTKPRLTTLMYMVDRPASIESFRQHAKDISIIAPQSFRMDAEGFVAGEVPPEVLQIAREKKVAVMPLVTNRGFKQDLMHTVLDSPESRARVIRYLLYFALRDGYVGFQFDYENIKYTYRDRFTAFFHEAAREFHRHGLLLTAAVVGKYSDDPSAESPGGFENWSGVYDYRALGKDADFLSIMAYPQHAGFSDPGPLAGAPWVGKIVDFTLSKVPARKISLGVPTYGIRWAEVKPGTVQKADFVQDNEGAKVKKWKNSTAAWPHPLPDLLKTNQPKWDETEKAHWFEFQQDGARNVVWYEDAASLQPKLKLVTDKRIGWGISGWVLGMEDPEIWSMIERDYRVSHPRTPVVKGELEKRARVAARALQSKPVPTLAVTSAGK
jgi:spore germination protein YaaH